MTSHIFSRSGRLRLGGVALVSAVVVALSGCNSAGEPEPVATASSWAAESTSPSPTPTATATYKPADATGRAQNVPVPALPEVAKTETKEGLEAFVAHWFQLLSYAYETGDSKPMEAISGPNCKFCGGLRDNISIAWSDDKWIVGGQIQTPVVTAKVLSGEPAQATVQVVQKSVAIHNPDGSLYQEPTKDTNAGSQATATYSASGWILTDLGLIR